MSTPKFRDIMEAGEQARANPALRDGQAYMTGLYAVSPALYQRVMDEDAKRAVDRARNGSNATNVPVDPFYDDVHLFTFFEFVQGLTTPE